MVIREEYLSPETHKNMIKYSQQVVRFLKCTQESKLVQTIISSIIQLKVGLICKKFSVLGFRISAI